MRRFCLLVAASAAISSAAFAQDTRSDLVACRDTVAAGLYRRCALWIDGAKVRRGEEGTVVGRPGLFRPTPMTGIVAGDSAMAYARTFERRSRQSNGFLLAGGLALAAGYIILGNRNCTTNIIGGCDYNDNRDWIGGSLIVGGFAISIPGLVLGVKAQHAAAKAVWWNNERFAR